MSVAISFAQWKLIWYAGCGNY